MKERKIKISLIVIILLAIILIVGMVVGLVFVFKNKNKDKGEDSETKRMSTVSEEKEFDNMKLKVLPKLIGSWYNSDKTRILDIASIKDDIINGFMHYRLDGKVKSSRRITATIEMAAKKVSEGKYKFSDVRVKETGYNDYSPVYLDIKVSGNIEIKENSVSVNIESTELLSDADELSVEIANIIKENSNIEYTVKETIPNSLLSDMDKPNISVTKKGETSKLLFPSDYPNGKQEIMDILNKFSDSTSMISDDKNEVLPTLNNHDVISIGGVEIHIPKSGNSPVVISGDEYIAIIDTSNNKDAITQLNQYIDNFIIKYNELTTPKNNNEANNAEINNNQNNNQQFEEVTYGTDYIVDSALKNNTSVINKLTESMIQDKDFETNYKMLGLLTAYNSNGTIVWQYKTSSFEATQGSDLKVVLVYNNKIILKDINHLAVYDLTNGNKIQDIQGSNGADALAYYISQDSKIFISSMIGPHSWGLTSKVFIFDSNGTFIKEKNIKDLSLAIVSNSGKIENKTEGGKIYFKAEEITEELMEGNLEQPNIVYIPADKILSDDTITKSDIIQ